MHEVRLRGVTPRPWSGAAAESARLRQPRNAREELPKSEVRGGREETPYAGGQGWHLREATPCPRPGVAAEKSYPVSEVRGGG